MPRVRGFDLIKLFEYLLQFVDGDFDALVLYPGQYLAAIFCDANRNITGLRGEANGIAKDIDEGQSRFVNIDIDNERLFRKRIN